MPEESFTLLDTSEQFNVGMADRNTMQLVVPDTPAAKAALKEMSTAQKAFFQFVNPRQISGSYHTAAGTMSNLLEIVFDDGTSTPFFWACQRRLFRGKLPLATELKRLLVVSDTAAPPVLAIPAHTDFAIGVNEKGNRTITSNRITLIFLKK